MSFCDQSSPNVPSASASTTATAGPSGPASLGMATPVGPTAPVKKPLIPDNLFENINGGAPASGFGRFMNLAVRNAMPPGVQMLLGSAGMKGMPFFGDKSATLTASDLTPVGNKPTPALAGMATPGMPPPTMTDPNQVGKGGGGGSALLKGAMGNL